MNMGAVHDNCKHKHVHDKVKTACLHDCMLQSRTLHAWVGKGREACTAEEPACNYLSMAEEQNTTPCHCPASYTYGGLIPRNVCVHACFGRDPVGVPTTVRFAQQITPGFNQKH